jgi:hypothetical protein
MSYDCGVCGVCGGDLTGGGGPDCTCKPDHLEGLLRAKELAVTALENLAFEFDKLGMSHYNEMTRGLVKSISGATIIVKEVIEKRSSD